MIQKIKFLLSICLLLVITSGFAQDMQIAVALKSEKLLVFADDDNSSKIFTIKKTNFNARDYLTATVINEIIDTSWQRSFTINNIADSEIAELKFIHKNCYGVSIKTLQTALQAGNEYSVYTIALPKDLQKRMLVKVARKLVCKIKVED